MKPQAIGGAFEGASKLQREVAMWSPPIQSADAEISGSKPVIDSRVKDLMRNDGYIRGAISSYQDGIVGGQYRLNATPNLAVLSAFDKRFDEAWSEEFQAASEAQFYAWGESSNNWADASRINTFTGLVRLAVGMYVYGGEVLSSAEWRGGAPMRTCIQMIDTDRLCNPNGTFDSPTLRRGVEVNGYGEPVAYHIRKGYPNDQRAERAYEWRRIKARKQWGRRQVIHIYEQSRPEQSRGISDLVAALKEMKMTKNYQEVVLQNAVINATFAATIESELPPAEAYAQLGSGSSTTAAEAYMTEVAKFSSGAKNMHIDGARIPHLYPGQKLSLLNAGNPGGIGTDFEASLLRHVAASLGLSYEQFSRDYTNTNYSSARAAMLETWKRMNSRKRGIADKFASSVYELWVEEALNMGLLPMPKGLNISAFYQGFNKDAVCAASWVGANRGQIDELKETQAAVLRMESGLSTMEEETARMGKDWRDVIKQQAREIQEKKNAGIYKEPTSSV